MHLSFLQSDGPSTGRSSLAAALRRAALRPDSLYFSIAIAAGVLWLALNCF